MPKPVVPGQSKNIEGPGWTYCPAMLATKSSPPRLLCVGANSIGTGPKTADTMWPVLSACPIAQPALAAADPPWKLEPSKKQFPRRTPSKGLLCQNTSDVANLRGDGRSTAGSGKVPRQNALVIALLPFACTAAAAACRLGLALFSLTMFRAEHS